VNVGDISIVIDEMPPLLLSIVGEALASCPGASVVAENVPPSKLAGVVSERHPDVVIIAKADAIGTEEEVARLLGPPDAKRRIITLFGSDRGARLHEWRHSVTFVDKLSKESLAAAITGNRNG